VICVTSLIDWFYTKVAVLSYRQTLCTLCIFTVHATSKQLPPPRDISSSAGWLSVYYSQLFTCTTWLLTTNVKSSLKMKAMLLICVLLAYVSISLLLHPMVCNCGHQLMLCVIVCVFYGLVTDTVYHWLGLDDLNYDLCGTCYQSVGDEKKKLYWSTKVDPFSLCRKVHV